MSIKEKLKNIFNKNNKNNKVEEVEITENEPKDIDVKSEKEIFEEKIPFLQRFQNMSEKLFVLIRWAIIIFAVIMLLIIAIDAFYKTAYFKTSYDYALEKTDYKYDNMLENLAYITCFLLIIYILQKVLLKIKLKYVIPIMLILIFVLFIRFIFILKLVPIADQGQMMILADAVYNDIINLHVNPGSYLDMFPYQFGFAYYAGTIFKIMDIFKNIITVDRFIVLQILNAIYSLISMIVLYFIGIRLFEKEDGQFHRHEKFILMILIACFSVYFMLFNTHVYGNIPGFMFAIISFLFTLRFVEKERWIDLIIAGISIVIAINFKTNYQIFLIAILGILFFKFMKNIRLRNVVSVILIGVIYITGSNLTDFVLEKNIGRAVPAGVPMITYMYMGWAPSNTLSSGWYTGDVINIYHKNDFDHIDTAEETKELFKKRINHFKNDLPEFKRYAIDKFESTWINPTFQTLWIATPDGMRVNNDTEYKNHILENEWIIESTDYTSQRYHFIERLFDSFSIIVFLFAGIGLISIIKRNDIERLLLIVTFIGGLVFHFVLWETKSIYVLPYYFLLLPYAAIGINKLFENIQILLSRLKKI